MARVFIGIGSNMGDRRGHIALARQALAELPRTRLVKFSPVYETAPVGPVQQEPFLNAAAELQTSLTPHSLLGELAAIEARAGRTPQDKRLKWGPRTLDLDILLYDDQVICGDELRVPHPMMHQRWFVLKPLADLDPKAVHPALEMTIGDLLKALEESQENQTPLTP